MYRYRPLKEYLMERFGCKVHRVSLDARLTCPNRDGTKGRGGCAFCNCSTLIPPREGAVPTIREQLLLGMEAAKKRRKAEKFIAYFQPNSNTYAPADHLEKLYREASGHTDIVALAVSTRPDCLNEEVWSLLESFSRKLPLWLELGLQSAHDSTLTALNRGHGVVDFEAALHEAAARDIPVCAHVILGLPGESKADMVATARFLARHDIWGVKLHPLHIQKGTRLVEEYRAGSLRVLDVDEYAECVVAFLEELPPHTIIHRLSGSTPEQYLIAPSWGSDRFSPPERIRQLLIKQNTRQGRRYTP